MEILFNNYIFQFFEKYNAYDMCRSIIKMNVYGESIVLNNSLNLNGSYNLGIYMPSGL